jgi:methionine-rich copper-binding protein CopC
MVRVSAGQAPNHISVVPNPLRFGNFRVDIQGIAPGMVDLKLYDLFGRLVIKESFRNEQQHDSHVITLPQNLQQGIYQLVIHVVYEKQVIKLVIE